MRARRDGSRDRRRHVQLQSRPRPQSHLPRLQDFRLDKQNRDPSHHIRRKRQARISALLHDQRFRHTLHLVLPLHRLRLKILSKQNMVDAIAPFSTDNQTRWFVIDRRHGKGLVTEYESEAAFCFQSMPGKMEMISFVSSVSSRTRISYINSCTQILSVTGKPRKASRQRAGNPVCRLWYATVYLMLGMKP